MKKQKKVERLDKILSSRGYCTRSEALRFMRKNIVRVLGEQTFDSEIKVFPEDVTFRGEPLDPGTGILIIMNKPVGYICSHDETPSIYELLPERMQRRNPKLSSIGRLDKDTSGLLLITDDGDLLHKINSPKNHIPKTYRVELKEQLRGNETELFASGNFMLAGEDKPLLAGELEVISEKLCFLTIHEGRYHQVKRMFAQTGNEVLGLARVRIGGMGLEETGVEIGGSRIAREEELRKLNINQ